MRERLGGVLNDKKQDSSPPLRSTPATVPLNYKRAHKEREALLRATDPDYELGRKVAAFFATLGGAGTGRLALHLYELDSLLACAIFTFISLGCFALSVSWLRGRHAIEKLTSEERSRVLLGQSLNSRDDQDEDEDDEPNQH